MKMILSIILSVFLFSPGAMADEIKDGAIKIIKMQLVGNKASISENALIKFIPDSMKIPLHSGFEIIPRNEFGIFILPIKDSSGLLIDSTSAKPKYLAILFSESANSSFVFLQSDGDSYSELWRSKEMFGEGELFLKDINGDNRSEIAINLIVNLHGATSLFFLSWTDGKMLILNPSGKVAGLSEFNGDVHIYPNDSGINISVIKSMDTLKSIYYIKRGSEKIIFDRTEKLKSHNDSKK